MWLLLTLVRSRCCLPLCTQRQALLAATLGHSARVLSLRWSPDEKQIVSVGADCCICVWNFFGGEGLAGWLRAGARASARGGVSGARRCGRLAHLTRFHTTSPIEREVLARAETVLERTFVTVCIFAWSGELTRQTLSPYGYRTRANRYGRAL